MSADTIRWRGDAVVSSGARRMGFALLITFGLPLAVGAAARAEESGQSELAANVSQVFEQKCAACHGPAAKKVKKFGYVTDLGRLAANPKLIVPHDPASSA